MCGYVHVGPKPPAECPQCSSSQKEFLEFSEKKRLKYDGKKFDVLLVNGSSHAAHNSCVMADLAEKALKKRGVSYRRFNLNELDVRHCWCCYSMRDSACTYPCRNQLDDAPALHEMLVQAKAVIVVTPINWNNMSARLKDFLDRLTSLQNLALLKKKSLTAGKVLGILVNGHEDGAFKTAMDVFVYFQELGFVLAPFGFAYRTHGAAYDAKTDNEFFSGDGELASDVDGAVANIAETMKLGIEGKLRNRLAKVCS